MSSDLRFHGPWNDRLPDPVPVVHRDLDVRVGGRELTTLTREHLEYWVRCIKRQWGNTFMVVARADEFPFIQTYRNSATDFDLQWCDAPPPAPIRQAVVNDEAQIVALLWAWLEGDRTELDTLDWESVDRNE
ncbi:hypothetical protein [Prescottella agglutinans]|jgi:hypothetical protein|uniref:Uncharacterized protein n=1 Tax=Prescottella agglutinans TaxID=1644129 RepID=A0ABT6MJL7_9NOCA|nr:hypothetical protein [Prescottella agglutinans]MDH6284508.1 hypothetical protein [Prescottella agglutinans]